MSGVGIEVIRHPVGADGTMRYRYTFHVAVDPSTIKPGTLRDQIAEAVTAALVDSRRVPFGTSREDGMPLDYVTGAAAADPRAAAFMAGYEAAWDNSGEGHNSEFTHATRDALDAAAQAALDAYLAGSK